jgi:RND superfamily putative drug exporter
MTQPSSKKNTSHYLPPKWLRVLLPAVLIIVWFAVAGIGGPYFGKIGEVSKLDLAAFLPKSAEATKVNNQLEKYRDKATTPAIIVFESRDNQPLSDEQLAQITTVRDTLAAQSYVAGDITPAIKSDDSKGAFILVPLQESADPKKVVPKMNQIISDTKTQLTHHVTGPGGFAADLGRAFAGIDGLLLVVALAVVFVILLCVYRSPILPILVLLTSMFALTASVLAVWLLAKAGYVTINGQVQGILFILVIGAATDYSLLYVARFREELHMHRASWHATKNALRSSLEPILASGGTVIAGLLCLLLSDLSSNTALGPVGSIGIAFAILAALTLLPAMLLACGRRAFWPFVPKYSLEIAAEPYENRHKTWGKIGHFVQRHPRPIWIITMLLLVTGLAGATQIRADGVSQSDLVIGKSDARDGQAMLNRHFPGGSGAPVQIITPASSQATLLKTLEADPAVASVSVTATNSDSGQKPLGKQEAEIMQKIRTEITKKLDAQKQEIRDKIAAQMSFAPPELVAQTTMQALANVPDPEKLAAEAYPFKNATPKVVDGNILLNATLTHAPETSEAKAAITRLRQSVHAAEPAALVGGYTAIQVDTTATSIRDRAIILPAILVAITIILMLLLRSILAPILLLLTTVLSFGTALGVAALLFNHVWNFPGADPSVVLYGFVFLVALGIDYNIFLMTRVREESLHIGTRKGVIKGLIITGGVITSAGIVLASTFAALSVIPILFLLQLAFIVAFGVLLDTIVVRSLLVPALIHDLGSVVWWPSKLRHKR